MTFRWTRPTALPTQSRQQQQQRNVRCAGVSAFVVVCAVVGSAQTLAQQKNNDYYASAGTQLLSNVETYHIGPALEKLRARYYESAYGDVAFILGYFPNHPQGLILMTQLCEHWKSPKCEPEIMLDVFERAVAVNPNVAATYVLRGIYLDRLKRIPDAVASLEKALSLDPDSVNAHYNLGLIYFEAKQFDRANAHAQTAYRLGAPLPGLRDKLKKAGHWKPMDTPTRDPMPSAVPDASESPARH